MKLFIQISKLHNYFFFVSNLAEWSPYCRKQYNEVWLRGNPLTAPERTALKKVAGVFKKHGFSDRFASSESPDVIWDTIAKTLKPDEYAALRNAFATLTPRFEKVWRREKGNLMRVQKEMKKSLSLSKRALGVLETLYGAPSKSLTLEIFLLTNPISKRLVGGGSGIGENKIELECSRVTKHNNPKGWLGRVILHEFVHVALEKELRDKIGAFVGSKDFRKRHEPFLKHSAIYCETRSFVGPIKEMVAVSLLPEGYLAEKIYGARVVESLKQRNAVRTHTFRKDYYDLMLFSLWGLYDIAKEYSDQRKPIDRRYIETVVRNWESFESMDLSRFDPE